MINLVSSVGSASGSGLAAWIHHTKSMVADTYQNDQMSASTSSKVKVINDRLNLLDQLFTKPDKFNVKDVVSILKSLPKDSLNDFAEGFSNKMDLNLRPSVLKSVSISLVDVESEVNVPVDSLTHADQANLSILFEILFNGIESVTEFLGIVYLIEQAGLKNILSEDFLSSIELDLKDFFTNLIAEYSTNPKELMQLATALINSFDSLNDLHSKLNDVYQSWLKGAVELLDKKDETMDLVEERKNEFFDVAKETQEAILKKSQDQLKEELLKKQLSDELKSRTFSSDMFAKVGSRSKKKSIARESHAQSKSMSHGIGKVAKSASKSGIVEKVLPKDKSSMVENQDDNSDENSFSDQDSLDELKDVGVQRDLKTGASVSDQGGMNTVAVDLTVMSYGSASHGSARRSSIKPSYSVANSDLRVDKKFLEGTKDWPFGLVPLVCFSLTSECHLHAHDLLDDQSLYVDKFEDCIDKFDQLERLTSGG